jgi:hypothetical protein
MLTLLRHHRRLSVSPFLLCNAYLIFSCPGPITPVLPPDFIVDLTNILALNDCEGLFGIDTLGGENWTELTISNASVVVPSNGRDREEAYIPVAFAFDDNTPGFRVHGRCGTDHKHTSKP